MSRIAIGNPLPNGTLTEFVSSQREGCSIGPNQFQVSELTKNKRIVIFSVPGAFTPTCSHQHAPGYIKHSADFFSRGVDEIWCVSVNDAFVMNAWGDVLKTEGKIRMLSDGNADWTKSLGFEADFSAYGMGTRSCRYSLFSDNGIIKLLNVEDPPGALDVSRAEVLLEGIMKK